jgi:hypothetical protein
MNIFYRSGLLSFALLILFPAIGYSQQPSTDPQQAEHLEQQIDNLRNQLNWLRTPAPSPWTTGRS